MHSSASSALISAFKVSIASLILSTFAVCELIHWFGIRLSKCGVVVSLSGLVAMALSQPPCQMVRAARCGPRAELSE